MKTAKEFLQNKHPYLKDNWQGDENIDDDLFAEECEVYARYYHEQKLNELGNLDINAMVYESYPMPVSSNERGKVTGLKLGAMWAKYWYLKNNK